MTAEGRRPVGLRIEFRGSMNLDGKKIHLYFYNCFHLQVQATKTLTITTHDCVTKRNHRFFL